MKKRNCEIRLTCDYRSIYLMTVDNARSIYLMTVDNAYGMADLSKLIERAAKAKYVSTIDLASAYWYVEQSVNKLGNQTGSLSMERYAPGLK